MVRSLALALALVTTLSPFAVTASPVSCDAPRVNRPPPASLRWTFEVHIVSGSREGQRWPGAFTVGELPPGGSGVVPVETFTFRYGRLRFTQGDLAVRVRFENGEPVELLGVGGPDRLRFGFSEGFGREQFGRDSEAFIANGEPYFGYLDPDTYVDGAGTVSFLRAE